MARQPMDKYTKERLAQIKRIRGALKKFGEEPTPYSGWTKNIGYSSNDLYDEVVLSVPGTSEEKVALYNPDLDLLYDPDLDDSYLYEEDTKFPVEDDGGGEEPPEETPPAEPDELPDPSEVIKLAQAIDGTKRPTTRPDRYEDYGYYGEGADKRSTRVQGIQWIPTGYTTVFEEANNASRIVQGDILVAFARQSASNPKGLIWRYRDHTISEWIGFENTSSFGRSVKSLRNGSEITDSDKERYKMLHQGVGYKDDWEDWIWDYPEFYTTRVPNDAK